MKVIKPPRPKYGCIFKSPIGKLGVVVVSDQVARIDFLSPKTAVTSPENLVVRRLVTKIKKYFSNPKLKFNLPMHFCGTLLQQKIWRLVQKIPCGKVTTYGELAKKVKTSPRVIGNACRLNPIPIIIPCHRVVAATGLGGYCGKTSGQTLKIKKLLLKHEGYSQT